jgi:hypothetical protein
MRQKLMLAVLVFLCGACAFFSCSSVILFAPERYQSARALWEQHDIRDYEAVVYVGLPLVNISLYRIVVRDGVVVEAGSGNIFFEEYDPNTTFYPTSISEVEDYTLEALMSLAGTTVGRQSTITVVGCGANLWEAEFDSEYGYVRSLRFGNGGGFLCDFWVRIGDCCGGYTVYDFRPLAR